MNNYFLKLSGELGGAIKHLQKLKHCDGPKVFPKGMNGIETHSSFYTPYFKRSYCGCR